MKRNWDTLREILFIIEALEPDTCLRLTDFEQSRDAEISYHVEILAEANLIDAIIPKSGGYGSKNFMIHRLTWRGHELLDAIRSEIIWKKTKELFKTNGIGMGVDLLLSVTTNFNKQALLSEIESSRF